MPSVITKLQKIGQRRAGAGWNKHVTPWQRRKAKKTIRRILHRLDESPPFSPSRREGEREGVGRNTGATLGFEAQLWAASLSASRCTPCYDLI